ncbi:MAG: oligosaccharide flippase family protein [Pyrinomonadaceae bacterium]|nr:oligosaccharide flippase family protein [Pyrinomonadaceae bacterium]
MNSENAGSGKSIVRNSLYGFSTWILPLGLSFFATPILVKALGDSDYGIYALVLGFIAYSFNFGIGRAVTKYIAEFRATGQDDRIREILSATFLLNFAVGLIGSVIIVSISKWLVADVFKIEPEFQTKTVYALYLSTGIIFSSMLIQVFSAVLQGIQRFDVYSKIYNFNIIGLIAGNIALALLGYGLLTLLVWNLIISGLTCAIYFIAARILLPEFGIGFGFSKESLKLVLKFSYGVIGYQILANFLLLFERGWITRKLGTEALTYYVVPMMLALYIHSFISSLMIIVFPLASELNENRKKLLRLYLKATKIVCIFTCFLAVTLIVLSKTFLTLWLGAEFADRSAILLIIHTITFSILAVQIVSWQMTEGLGFPNYIFKMFSVCLIIAVSGFVLTADLYGNTGIALSRLAGFAAITGSIFYIENWFFGNIQWRFWLRVLATLLIAGAAAGAVEYIVSSRLPLSWIYYLISVGTGGVVYLFLVWIMGLVTKEERAMVKGLFAR